MVVQPHLRNLIQHQGRGEDVSGGVGEVELLVGGVVLLHAVRVQLVLWVDLWRDRQESDN